MKILTLKIDSHTEELIQKVLENSEDSLHPVLKNLLVYITQSTSNSVMDVPMSNKSSSDLKYDDLQEIESMDDDHLFKMIKTYKYSEN